MTAMTDSEIRIALGVVLVVGVCVTLYAALFRKEEVARLYPVWDRIRKEVEVEYQPLLRSAAGMKKWWLLLKRNREVSRRVGRVIFSRVAS